MKIKEALESLENSWSREDVLLKIKNGENSEKIVNQFFHSNKKDIEKLSNYIRPEDRKLLNQIEELSTCEAKLINKIRNSGSSKDVFTIQKENEKNIYLSNKLTFSDVSSLMLNWSNRFVVILLLTVSAIALSKQAWS